VRVERLSAQDFFPAEQNRALLDRQRIDNIMAGTPMNRFGEPRGLIGAAILLLSALRTSYITGCDMYVDGGFTSMRF
jgi:NAD(P)-dependent dehydrogenase (short-subunit alcohol dehydrogenase family)